MMISTVSPLSIFLPSPCVPPLRIPSYLYELIEPFPFLFSFCGLNSRRRSHSLPRPSLPLRTSPPGLGLSDAARHRCLDAGAVPPSRALPQALCPVPFLCHSAYRARPCLAPASALCFIDSAHCQSQYWYLPSQPVHARRTRQGPRTAARLAISHRCLPQCQRQCRHRSYRVCPVSCVLCPVSCVFLGPGAPSLAAQGCDATHERPSCSLAPAAQAQTGTHLVEESTACRRPHLDGWMDECMHAWARLRVVSSRASRRCAVEPLRPFRLPLPLSHGLFAVDSLSRSYCCCCIGRRRPLRNALRPKLSRSGFVTCHLECSMAHPLSVLQQRGP
ncbi:hypothetical protein C8Q70DRAFT_257645 [Cubamyces menziesii]|nr:hypothetical protein C8Q70DRAFT_257645 [Cubamyces menziesii]